MTTILVVEDNAQNRKLAELLLNQAGYGVLSASNGEDGLAIARERQPDLVLMDVQMPGLDGLAVTRLLKNSPGTAHIKVVAITAQAMKGDAERILASGCDGYLAKPYQYKELAAVVRNALS